MKGTNHQRDATGNFTTYGAFSAPILKQNIPTSAWSQGLSPGNFLSGIAVPGSLTQAWEVNPAFAQQVLEQRHDGAFTQIVGIFFEGQSQNADAIRRQLQHALNGPRQMRVVAGQRGRFVPARG